MTTPDPVDELLGSLKPVEPPVDVQPQAERAFLNHAEASKQSGASAWRVWGRWLEPALVGLFVLIFVVWAFRRVFFG
jgi:hypothetical protein